MVLPRVAHHSRGSQNRDLPFLHNANAATIAGGLSKQNSGVLREEMAKGLPIRDASPGNTAGQFLNAERNLLESRGWTFDANTNFWNPPK